MQIERGTLNTLLVNARPTLTPSRWLLWFRDPERNASVYCLCSALVAGSPTLIRFEETDTPTALNGQVKLSPPGNWTLKIYEQSSTTNLNPANATRLVEERAVFVVGAVEPESGWSGTECPPGGGDCDPTTVNGTESDVRDISVRRGGVEVGTLAPSTGIHTVPECDPCPPCDPLTVTVAGVEIVNEADPCGVDVALTCADLVDAVVVEGAGTDAANGLYVRSGEDNGQPEYTSASNYRIHYEYFGIDDIRWSIDDDITDSLYSADSGVNLFDRTWSVLNGSGPVPTVSQATIGDICGGGDCPPCDNVTVQLRDSAASPIGAPDVYAAGTTTTKTAPDASWTLKDTAGNTLDSGAIASGGAADIEAPDAKVQLKDSAGNNIGSLNVYLSGSINNLTAPDGTFRTTDGLTAIAAVKSNGTADAPQTRVPYKDAANADQLTTAADTEFASGTLRPAGFIPRITIYESDGVTVQGYADIGTPFYTVDACPPSSPAFVKFIWQAGDADTYLWTVTSDEAGTYGTYTPTGTNGTLTYSKNGGGYAALSGAITLAVSDTITVRRTTTTNAGSVKWEA